MSIFYLDANTEISQYNPFSIDKYYHDNWIIFKLTDDAAYNMIVGRGKSNTYEVVMSKDCDGYLYRMMDFIMYYEKRNFNIVLCANKRDLRKAKVVYGDSTNQDIFLRGYEPKILVHSTLREYIPLIKKSRRLKSWQHLKREKLIYESKPIGELLQDPKEFSEYVMLGQGIGCEIVVSSKQKKQIDMNIDTSYIPGGRFYFDAERIASNGLFERDGIHYKVKDELPLDPYLLCLVTKEMVTEEETLTPRQFSKLADAWVEKNIFRKGVIE